MNKRQIIASLNSIANELDNSNLYKEANTLTKIMMKLADDSQITLELDEPTNELDEPTNSVLDKKIPFSMYYGPNDEPPGTPVRIGDMIEHNINDWFGQIKDEIKRNPGDLLVFLDWFGGVMRGLGRQVIENANFSTDEQREFQTYFETLDNQYREKIVQEVAKKFDKNKYRIN
jgi:hypothetical protein